MLSNPVIRLRLAIVMLILSIAALLACGLVMIYSTTMAQWGTYYLARQILWSVLGVGTCVIAASVDYQVLRKLALPAFVLAVVLLVLVLASPLGIERNNARRWFGYGKTSMFQPSEFAKLAIVLVLAWYGARFQRQMTTFTRGLLIPGLLIGLVAGLVFVGPDFGTALLIGAIGYAMLIVCGVRWGHLMPLGLAACIGFGVFAMHNPKCIERLVYGWLKGEQNIDGAAYQAYQAKLAIGSGGWRGLGIGDGVHKQGFVPEAHTDFIFSVIGEEAGLLGTMSVLLAFVMLVLSGTIVAVHARDPFGMLLTFGITFWIGLQAAINIGVVTSTFPNKGLPLPFVSYGGSNFTASLTSVGILLSVGLCALKQQIVPDQKTETEEIAEPELARC